MWSVDEILRNDKFDNLSKSDLLEVISVLRNDLKYYKYRKDSHQEQLVGQVNALRLQLEAEQRETERLRKVNANYRGKLTQPMTFWERIKGRIDLGN